MFGLNVNWKCSYCNTEMHDHVGIVSLYKVNGVGGFLHMGCDKCKKEHYVSTKNGTAIPLEDVQTLEDGGVCCF